MHSDKDVLKANRWRLQNLCDEGVGRTVWGFRVGFVQVVRLYEAQEGPIRVRSSQHNMGAGKFSRGRKAALSRKGYREAQTQAKTSNLHS